MKKKVFINIIIFLLILAYFFILQGTSHFADPDCFYNARMALLMKKQLVFKQFPWMEFTVFKNNYIDHHFLYHIFLIPFVSLSKIGISPLLGVKISAILFAAFLIFTFYFILERWQIRYPLIFIFLLLISTPFVFRASLARAPAVSGIFLLLSVYFILKDSQIPRLSGNKTRSRALSYLKIINWPLFIISFFYVWLYSAWMLLPVVLTFYWTACFCQSYGRRALNSGREKWLKNAVLILRRFFILAKKVFKEEKPKILSCLAGILAGLIINPYFPRNLKSYLSQIYQIVKINFHQKFSIGVEWYPYDPIHLYRDLFIFFVILSISVALFFVFSKKRDKKTWTLFLITSFFFIYTLKARRSVEYFVPFGVLFAAAVYDKIFNKKSWDKLEIKFKRFFTKKQQAILIILIGILVFVFPYFIYHDLINTHQELRHFKFNHLQKVSGWLKQNVEPGKTIFNSNWDHFGFLFYHNPNNYYITGLDQRLMYAYNPALFELYLRIIKGDETTNLKDKIRNKFNSEYILVSQVRNKKFYHNLEVLKKDFKMVYKANGIGIFKITKNNKNTN